MQAKPFFRSKTILSNLKTVNISNGLSDEVVILNRIKITNV